jgi:hypothetical protein
MTGPEDGEIILEVDFRHDYRQMERAAAAVAAAVAEIREGYPANERVDLLRRKRAERFFETFADLSLIELAVAEYLTREAQERAALDLPGLIAEAAGLSDQLQDLIRRIGAAKAAMQWTEAKGAGQSVAESIDMAHGHAVDGWQELHAAGDALRAAARHMPGETRGRSGALGRLTLSPEVALLQKLTAMWEAVGLTTAAGDSGRGIDLFLYHALASASPEKVSGGRWLEKLREKARRELSRENAPPK